jgi:hypothetical protein
MMAALTVLDNFKMGIGRQQTDGVFIPKRCSEPLFASNELCTRTLAQSISVTAFPLSCHHEETEGQRVVMRMHG